MEQELVKLYPLKDSAYDEFMNGVRQRYAAARMEGNLFTEEEAIVYTENEWARLLPKGKDSLGHFFFQLVDSKSNSHFGITWLFIDQDTRNAFIFEIFLRESSRGKGIGRSTLAALESFSKSKGASTLGLNVFANNTSAKSLYVSFGFQEVSTDMIKTL